MAANSPPQADNDAMDFETAAESIVSVGRRLDKRGLAPATAGNYSVRLADGTFAITASGVHKGRLSAQDVMRVSPSGAAVDGGRPSAETLVHCLIYSVDRRAGAVLHTHSIAGTALSRAYSGKTSIAFEGYEVLKAYPGVVTHETIVSMPLIENDQDMPVLAERLRPILEAQSPMLPAFYIRGHGLYAWGPAIAEAENIAEASEFLIACAWEEWKGTRR
jgi:methylthioribulose-1-phosphate dehydratase